MKLSPMLKAYVETYCILHGLDVNRFIETAVADYCKQFGYTETVNKEPQKEKLW